jgi:hypothetical protein
LVKTAFEEVYSPGMEIAGLGMRQGINREVTRLIGPVTYSGGLVGPSASKPKAENIWYEILWFGAASSTVTPDFPVGTAVYRLAGGGGT